MKWVIDLLQIVPNVVQSYAARKQAKLESELRVNEAVTAAKIEAVKQGDLSAAQWENLQVQNAGWKDEWFVVVLSIPLVMSFVPGMEGYVMQGFNVLSGTPEWYQWMVAIAVSASFGYRKLADWATRKNGGGE